MSYVFNSTRGSGGAGGANWVNVAYIIDGSKEPATKKAYAAMFPHGPFPSQDDWASFFMRLDRVHGMSGDIHRNMQLAHDAAKAIG